MAEITNIACRRLHPHPDNPRKELGDLTELAASIRENGIFQNLTVIPGHYMTAEEYADSVAADGGSRQSAMAVWNPKIMWSSDDYTIIIGHRRAAAAQQAGLFEVPCVVVEMDEREQLQTMMIENMQRTDLTTYEQAQGFQLMLDLGDTVEQVASKSGFSQSTIRRRVKLLSLDRDAFRRAELRGATLSDYAELDKIESVEDKNKALEALGTQNFRRVMQEVLENQKWEHRKAEWIADLKKFAIEDPNATYQTHEHVTGYSKWNITKDVVVPEDAENASLLINFCFPAERVPINGYISLLPHCLYLIILRCDRGHAHPDQPVLAIRAAFPFAAERFKCGNHAVVADLRLGRQPLSVIVVLGTAGSNVHLGIRPGVCPLVIQPFGQTLEGSANIGNFHGLLLYHS